MIYLTTKKFSELGLTLWGRTVESSLMLTHTMCFDCSASRGVQPSLHSHTQKCHWSDCRDVKQLRQCGHHIIQKVGSYIHCFRNLFPFCLQMDNERITTMPRAASNRLSSLETGTEPEEAVNSLCSSSGHFFQFYVSIDHGREWGEYSGV